MMKKIRQDYKSGELNNLGFSLVELIISIAILVIIMTPLMNNFFRAKMINNKAQALQEQSNLAANIMEGLKTGSMAETIQQFSGLSSFNIIFDQAGNLIANNKVTRLLKAVDDTYSFYPGTDEQATNYFAINGYMVGGTAYDTLITLDSSHYSDIYEFVGTMNNYLMPNIINLDKKANGLLFSQGVTEADMIESQVLTTFQTWGIAYAEKLYETSPAYIQYQDDLLQYNQGNPNYTVLPTMSPFNQGDYDQYCNINTIKTLITKTMKVIVDQNKVDYQIIFDCGWVPADIQKTITYQVSITQYAENIENVYLFYVPSSFNNINQEKIIIENKNLIDPTVLPINFYVAKQSTITDINISISRVYDNVMVYVNDNDPSNVFKGDAFTSNFNPSIMKTEGKVRICDVTIKICKYVKEDPIGDYSNHYKKVLYTLKSTKEE